MSSSSRAERPPSRNAVVRRRRAALAVVAALAAIIGLIVGASSGSDPPPAGGESEAEVPTCPAAIKASDRRLAGQMLVVRMEDSATPALRRAIARGELGGVILFPSEGADPQALAGEIGKLDKAASRAGSPSPLVAIDQEGGEVKRFPGLPPAQRPAAIQQPEVAASEGENTGAALEELGIDVDLAPVVERPAAEGAFIESRAFGGGDETATASATAFAQALQQQGVAATAKHFPGLGRAVVNSDDAPSAVEAPRDTLLADLEPFEAAVESGVALTMTANASYPALDPELPASLSPRITGRLLRERLGFEGVVITDDLGAGAIAGAGYSEGDAAVAAAAAGSDLLLFALSDGQEARAALVSALRAGELDREALVASCARATALRAAFG